MRGEKCLESNGLHSSCVLWGTVPTEVSGRLRAHTTFYLKRVIKLGFCVICSWNFPCNFKSRVFFSNSWAEVLGKDKRRCLISWLLRAFGRTIEKQPPFFWKTGLIPAPEGHHSSRPVTQGPLRKWRLACASSADKVCRITYICTTGERYIILCISFQIYVKLSHLWTQGLEKVLKRA